MRIPWIYSWITLIITLFCQTHSWCFRTSLSIGNQIREVDWSHDDSTFISIHKNQNMLRIFDAKSYELLKTYQYIPTGTTTIQPMAAKISKDSKYIGVGYINGHAVILHNTPPFDVYFWRDTGLAKVFDIDFNYLNTQFVTCEERGTLRMWDIPVPPNAPTNGVQTPVNDHNFTTGGGHITVACRWGPTGHIALINVRQQARYYNPSPTPTIYGGTTLSTSTGGGNQTGLEIDFLPNSDSIVVVTKDGRFLRNASASSFTTVMTNSQSGGALTSISVGKNSKYIAMGGFSKKLFIFDQATPPNLVAKFPGFASSISSVRISKNEDIIIVGTFGGQISIYGTKCGMFKCESGEYLNAAGSCQKCSDQISFCVTCKSASACELCAPGFYKDGSDCTACHTPIEYCLECMDGLECLKCLDGYYLDSANTKKCLRCPQAGCIECNTSSICTKCFRNDFYLDTDMNECKICAQILTYCVRCADANNCSDCQIGFYKNIANKCTECPGNCLACQSDTNCTQCKVGYFASGGSCNRCTVAACISCNQTGVCYDCKEGTFLTTGNLCTVCNRPCATCSVTANNCTGCNIGHYLNQATSTFTCDKCIENCRFCNESAKCLSCFPGFKVDGTSKTCKACSNYHDNCSQCTSIQCIKCRDGYWIDTAASNVCKTCISAIPKCMSCSNDTKCTQCAIGYFHTGAAASASCSACAAGCQECISVSNCTNCFPTFWKNGLVCEPCKSNCFECSSDVLCNSCVVGHFLDVSTCKSCQSVLAHCSACTDLLACIACMPKTYLDTADSKCKLCSLANCLTCNKTVCFSCEVGFYLDTTVTSNVCAKCSQFCQECTSLAVCTSCIDGYFFDSSDNKCKACAINFPHCTLCNITNCLSCDQGTELNTTYNNECAPCTNFIANCKSCFWDHTFATAVMKCSLCSFGFGLAANSLTCPACNLLYGCIECKSAGLCTKCEIGFYLKNDNTCGLCAPNCLTCNTALTCLACKDGYVSDGTGCVLCESKIEGCSKCIKYTAITFNCTYCQMGFWLSGVDKKCHICHKQIKGCYTCNDSSTCTSCLDKYFLDLTVSPNCQKCVDKIPGCHICNSSSVCLSCADSYYLDASTKKCMFCSNNITGCLHCKNNSVCSQCESGYFLTGANVCSLCEGALQGCIFCNSLSYCLQCRTGYYLNSGDNKCYKCSQPGCDICSESSPSVCVICNSKHYLMGSSCQTCQTRVALCDECDNVNCYQCEVGYFLASPSSCTQCSLTISGCSRCFGGNVCIECMSSYFVNSSNQCEECNQVMFGCQNCIDDSTCISCEANFFLNSTSDKCQPCTDISGCLLCRNETTCVMCQEKYFMDVSKCTLCSEVLKGCFSCASDTVCIQCQSGYVLDPVFYTCKASTVEAKEAVEGIKLITYYVSKNMLKHVMVAKGATFRKSQTMNITANGMTKMFIEDYSGKEVQLTVLSYEFGSSGNSIIFYTDNPAAEKLEQKKKKMAFRRLLEAGERLLTEELNLEVLVKMDETVYREILPDLDYKGSMTVGYSLNNPEFMNSYVTVEAGGQYFMYEAVGMVTLMLFLINYVIKFLFTMPQSRNRSTLLPHIIAIKSCCLILYPSHFEYISFCKGFMVVDFPWLNQVFATELLDASDHVQIPFGLFFQNMSFAGTFLLGFIVYVTLNLIVQAYFYVIKEPEEVKSEQTESDKESEEFHEDKGAFKIQNLEEAMGINYDNDDSEATMKKRNYLELFWNVFAFSMCYYACLSVQGAFYNYSQVITINGAFYIFGMLVFIYATIETFYAFFRNFRNISKVRIYIKACLLSLAYLNPIYIVCVCVIFDMLMAAFQFYVVNKPNQFSKFFILTHVLSSVVIGLMIFVSGSLVSLFSTALCLVICFGFELFIHIKEYQNSNKSLEEEEFKMEENEERAEGSAEDENVSQNNNVWDLGRKIGNKRAGKKQMDLMVTMQEFGSGSQFDMGAVQIASVAKNTQFLSQEKKVFISNEDEKDRETKKGGRRNRNRMTQDGFKPNLIEVMPRNSVRNSGISAGQSKEQLHSNFQ